MVDFVIVRDTLTPQMTALIMKAPRAIGSALYKEALIEMRESMRRTPVQYGALRASHRTLKPEYTTRDVTVLIQVGGAAAPYAPRVHDDLEAFHKEGRSQFLLSTLKESAPFIAQRVWKRLPEELKAA